jgi:hypothetical protein
MRSGDWYSLVLQTAISSRCLSYTHTHTAATHLVLTLATAAAARPALRNITPNEAAAPVLPVGGVDAGNLPSLERKVQKMLHQEQIG